MLPCKLRLTGLNDSVVRPVFSLLATNAYTKLLGIFGFLALVIIFRSRICLSEHFFLYDIIGSLRISLSNGCCCTKCHLLLRISYDLEIWNCWIVLSVSSGKGLNFITSDVFLLLKFDGNHNERIFIP